MRRDRSELGEDNVMDNYEWRRVTFWKQLPKHSKRIGILVDVWQLKAKLLEHDSVLCPSCLTYQVEIVIKEPKVSDRCPQCGCLVFEVTYKDAHPVSNTAVP